MVTSARVRSGRRPAQPAVMPPIFTGSRVPARHLLDIAAMVLDVRQHRIAQGQDQRGKGEIHRQRQPAASRQNRRASSVATKAAGRENGDRAPDAGRAARRGWFLSSSAGVLPNGEWGH